MKGLRVEMVVMGEFLAERKQGKLIVDVDGRKEER